MENHVFSGRAGNYVKFRSDYPASLKKYLVEELGINSNDIIADIGFGTGLLSRWFLELGAQVYGVEPNSDMRKEGERNLAEFAKFKSVVGSAEHTSLPDHSLDWIVAGNAFHWFDPEKTKKEFQRILKPRGRVFLVRTDWKEHPSQRMQEYDRIIMKYCVGRGGVVTDPDLERKTMDAFFTKYSRANLGESLTQYTREQLKGRFLSTSYSPQVGHPQHDNVIKELDELFDKYEEGEYFSFGILATVVCGSL